MIYVLPIFKISPYSGLCVNTTSGIGQFRELSPFVLGPIHEQGTLSENFENLWQYSKVYKKHTDESGFPSLEWWSWHYQGFSNKKAIRYPMGKGAIPEYSFWDGRKLGYVEARKQIYATIYGKYVSQTRAFRELSDLYGDLEKQGSNLVLLDYDAYDHRSLGMGLTDVINEPKRKMGHAFVLMMLLTNEFKKCVGIEGGIDEQIE